MEGIMGVALYCLESSCKIASVGLRIIVVFLHACTHIKYKVVVIADTDSYNVGIFDLISDHL